MDINRRNREIAHHIFSGSNTMIGVCITVITLFKITSTSASTIADEIIGFDAMIFIISSFLSYMSLRYNNHRKLEIIADTFFFGGMAIMVLVGLMIIYIAY